MGRRPSATISQRVVGLRLSALVLVIGLLVTSTAAATRTAALRRERDLLFEAEAASVQQAIVTAAERRVEEFRSGVNFLAATHPGPIEEYEQFFRRELGRLEEDEPGVLLLEEVSTVEFDRLTERERRLGSPDFEITSFPNPSVRRLIITRTVQDIDAFGLRLRGLDTTIVRDTVLPTGFTNEDFELNVVESNQLLAFAGQTSDLTRLDDLTAVLIAGVVDRDGRFLGYAVRFDSLDTYLGVLDDTTSSDLNVELWTEGIDRPIGRRLSPNAGRLATAELSARRNVETASLQWSINVWANDDFGPDARLLAQTEIWVAGLTVTVMLALGVSWRDRTNRELDSAHSELARARAMAATDSLTGLLNRAGLIDAARGVDLDLPAALFFVDLDGFKSVNDESGHERGDQVLIEVAGRLLAIFRRDDLVGRLGGDEFVIFTIDAAGPGHIDRVSERITTAISEIDPRITASLGVATRGRGDGTDVKALLRAADEAMYEAKRAGGDRHARRPVG
ncbi:MAG: GGDEF domain-containing protein [Acidimicrobiia bacterium]|nr:GGDEF domain-containing protein [Acidimicrobiia bacterium]